MGFFVNQFDRPRVWPVAAGYIVMAIAMAAVISLVTYCLGAWATTTSHQVVRDSHCAAIELNHRYDDCGKWQFDQFIFWDAEGHVIAWRLKKKPMRVRRTRGGWEMIFSDAAVLRRVSSPSYRESWTQYDPEMLDRENLAIDQRRGL